MSARLRRSGVIVAVGVIAVAALSGCGRLMSQVGALTAVGGDRAAAVGAAADDILIRERVQVMQWPQCSETKKAVSCTGATLDGVAITVESPSGSPLTMTITVGTRELFRGDVQPILDEAAGQKP